MDTPKNYCELMLQCFFCFEMGDFCTRISVFDPQKNDLFETEKIIFQYAHNYSKLPIW